MKRDTRRSGQTMVEYIIIVVVIAIAALAVFGILGDTVKDKAGGAVTKPHSVCYNAPPSSKRGPGDGYGAFEADKAITYITERY